MYAPITVGHMFTGKAYARALRGHFLASSALLTLLLETFWVDLSVEEKNHLTELYNSEDPSSKEDDELAVKIVSWFEEKKTTLASSSRTSALWLNYTQYVTIAQAFIKAERTNDWLSHIAASRSMLNLFAATGHNNYAKTCRLYLQSMQEMKKDHPIIFEQFMLGNHTVRRIEKKWAGIWTDMSIEQILMKSLKGRGGVIGKGMTENVIRVWTKTMHRCAEVSNAMNNLFLAVNPNNQRKELFAGRVKRDNDDFKKIQAWFQTHNPFECGEKLISLDSGLVDENNSVNCDRAEEIGVSIQSQLDGVSFTKCFFKRKDQVYNLQSLYSSDNIDDEKVTVDPLTLFLRLIVAVERMPENKIDDYFSYELSPYPMSLFNGGIMRSGTKANLKAFLLK